MKIILTIIALLSICSGCATVTSSHIAPTSSKIETSKIVPTEFEIVWNGLVRELSGSFFMVNNIDKNSRFINISFSTDSPSKYVNCGKIELKPAGTINAKSIIWVPTITSTIQEVGLAGEYQIPVLVSVLTKPRLEGRINLYLAPQSEKVTEARVAVRYIFSISKKLEQPMRVFWTNDSTTESFTTNEASDNWKCVATGELERELLNLVK